MSSTYIFLALVTSGIVTFAIRLFPFLVLRNQTNLSNRMQFISAVLPQAIITILVVYCLKDISFINAPFGIPETHCRRNRCVVAMVEGKYIA